MKKFFKGILWILGGFVLVVLGLTIFIWINSPGKTAPFTGADGKPIAGSIAAVEKISLGGVDQYLIIRGANQNNPVMLFLHGGPGSPEYAFMKEFNPYLENDFVMVYWEQRGAGKSWSKNIPPESMTLEQMISDTRELSEYLATRFGKEKIFVMGHSWGSFLGILTAYQYPELFHAYFGIGQVANQYRAEKVSFEWVKEQARKNNDNKAIETLESLKFPDLQADTDAWKAFLMPERNFVMRYGGGVTRELKSMVPLVKIVFTTREYTFSDKMNFMKGSMFSLEHLWLDVVNTNLFNTIYSMQVPVYIFQGVFDYQTPYVVAREFFEQLKAPQKEFFTFEKAAHSPLFEEVERFNGLINDLQKL
ncbi:MAG: alpha/beta hydrolase [Bacteroidales bacterium]|nr:alpha/beta hydrolase [Bacteroidales bacterium]